MATIAKRLVPLVIIFLAGCTAKEVRETTWLLGGEVVLQSMLPENQQARLDSGKACLGLKNSCYGQFDQWTDGQGVKRCRCISDRSAPRIQPLPAEQKDGLEHRDLSN